MYGMRLIGPVTIVLFAAACVPSVNPFYSDDDVRYEPELNGTWRDSEGSGDTWTFERVSGEDAYRLTVVSDETRGTFRATYFEIDGQRFLDLLATDIEFADGQLDLVNVSVFPGHILMHVADLGTELRMALMDPDWLGDFLEMHPGALSHRNEGDKLLLTASTRKLQRFIMRHLKDDEMFGDYGEFRKEPRS